MVETINTVAVQKGKLSLRAFEPMKVPYNSWPWKASDNLREKRGILGGENGEHQHSIDFWEDNYKTKSLFLNCL